ncbi:MAG TPA: SDR family NAD(P)-dependent oxidoreductase [Polyangiaceae bacterium]|jgi:NAD(P)-dependent dehydrogenase (short-subunit alcohol dehydrogenase family)
MIHPIEVNLTGKVAVVTGANTGIGKEIARDLARLNARVLMACRSEARGRAALDEIVADTGNHKTELHLVDISSRASVEAFGAALREKEPEVHILVNNAGVWLEERRRSVDGIELTWATNVLGAHRLTSELLPLLERGGKPGAGARIVNVASELAHSLDVSDVELERRGYDGMTAYAQSKQAERLWTWALARRLQGKAVTANAMHPGWVQTEIASRERGVKNTLLCTASKFFARAPNAGADTASWLAASVQVEGVSGRFYMDRADRECRFRDPGFEEAVWNLCERMAGVGRTHSTSSTTFPNPSLLAT